MLNQVGKEAIVVCRFGSLNLGLQPVCTLREIQKEHDVPITTITRVLREFEDNNGQFVVNKRGRRSAYIPP